jgi:hypothetical protein
MLGNSASGTRGTWSRPPSRLVALVHHHPAHIFEHLAAVGLAAGRAHEHDAGLAIGILLEPDHLGDRADGVARIDRRQEPAARIAEIGDRVERDVRNALAEHDVKGEQIVDRCARIADRLANVSADCTAKRGP